MSTDENWEEHHLKTKSFSISKQLVSKAYKLIKANQGAAGVDGQSLDEYDKDITNNLYKLWNRMSSGSYFPAPVKAVPIPKKSGGERTLGIPTVEDRIAQMVAKLYLEPIIDPIFHKDSYGYRPGKSAHQALAVTRKRCFYSDWVLEFDIKGLFDNINHELLLKALRFHTDCKWILLYVTRWLETPMQRGNEIAERRDKGTPQGGVISPLLANLFLHYAFDAWMVRTFPKIAFCRYADDGVIHCISLRQAEYLRNELAKRFQECGLKLHPDKTRIVYCKDGQRNGKFKNTSFDFLGYTFRPRMAKSRSGGMFLTYTPAMSKSAAKSIRQTVRSWRIRSRTGSSIEDLSKEFSPQLRGWMNYYCRFRPSEFGVSASHFNWVLARWVMRKYKRFEGRQKKARMWLAKIADQRPNLFPHWKAGYKPT